MKRIAIDVVPGFEQWRLAARECLFARLPPDRVIWNDGTQNQADLFGASSFKPVAQGGPVTVPKQFLELAQTACCHSDPAKFALLYRILWRISFENRHLLQLATDDDVMRLNAMVKAVRRDAYKITAFLRFREIYRDGKSHYVAWYETEHYSLERVLPFFQTRFCNMCWSILTPYRAAHWNGEVLTLEENPSPGLYPDGDQIENYWLTYYANIFNPARPKKSAMLNQMPKKYWKNMPETALVPDLLRNAETRPREMIHRSRNSD